MPYYTFCSKCNSDGNYLQVDKNCTKCSGTGNDWRDDRELERYHRWSEITLDELKEKKTVISPDGVKFFYKNIIPSIKDERNKVKGFKPIADTSKQDEENARRDFEARVGFFTKNFYLEGGVYSQAKYYKGVFDKVSLSISFVGADNIVLKKIKELLKTINTSNNLNEIVTSSEITQRYPEAQDLFELQELMAHEFFHLLQFLDCRSVNVFYRATRKHHIIRAQLLSTIIKLGVVSKNNTNLFSSILSIEDESTRKYFMELIKNSRMESLIFRNFFLYESRKTDLKIIDILEGAALAFQKVANRTEAVDGAFDVNEEVDSMHKRYYGAWDFYKKQGGKERTVFLLMAHQSLKYGLLDDGDYMNVVPIPQDIFIYLCEKVSTYEKTLCDLAQTRPFSIDSHLNDLQLSNEKISLLYALTGIMDSMKDDIKSYSIKVNTYHDDDIFEAQITYDENHIWNPLKVISDKISDEFPIFQTKYFVPLLIVDYSFYSNFMFNYLPNLMRDVEFTGVLGEVSSIEADNYILSLVDDVDEYIRSGFSYCCDNHSTEKVNRFEINFCESQNGLKNRFKKIAQRELSEVFV